MTSRVDGVGDLLSQAFLVFRGRCSAGYFLVGIKKRVGVDNALTLHGEFLNQESDGHELVLHAGAKDSVIWVRTRGIW